MQVPLYVATKMASIKRSSFFVPSSEEYAQGALRWIGYEPRCTPYWPHSLIWGLLHALPESIIDAWRLHFCLKIRKRGQHKDSKKKEQINRKLLYSQLQMCLEGSNTKSNFIVFYFGRSQKPTYICQWIKLLDDDFMDSHSQVYFSLNVGCGIIFLGLD